MAVLLTGMSATDGQTKRQAPVAPSAEGRSAGENAVASAPAPEGFSVPQDGGPDAEASLTELLRLMKQEQYDVIPSLSGYLITEDPTYLPEDGTVRAMARRLGRDRMLTLLISVYLRTHTDAEKS